MNSTSQRSLCLLSISHRQRDNFDGVKMAAIGRQDGSLRARYVGGPAGWDELNRMTAIGEAGVRVGRSQGLAFVASGRRPTLLGFVDKG